MATIPEYGTLGFNRGRAMNEPLSAGEQSAIDAHEYLWGRKPSLVGDDPILKMQESHLTAGAIGTAIGMLGMIGALVYGWLENFGG